MKTSVNIEFFVKGATEAVQRGDVVIVIDVLRCCSTIVTALANGAKRVTPSKTLKEALMLHYKHPEFILAGERRGMKPKGFDLGNSPLEFSSEKVKRKAHNSDYNEWDKSYCLVEECAMGLNWRLTER